MDAKQAGRSKLPGGANVGEVFVAGMDANQSSHGRLPVSRSVGEVVGSTIHGTINAIDSHAAEFDSTNASC